MAEYMFLSTLIQKNVTAAAHIAFVEDLQDTLSSTCTFEISIFKVHARKIVEIVSATLSTNVEQRKNAKDDKSNCNNIENFQKSNKSRDRNRGKSKGKGKGRPRGRPRESRARRGDRLLTPWN